jgi:predicted Ser/Thr protein kinase
MDRKVDPSVAETVAASSLRGEDDSDISRVTSGAAEDEGRFVPGTLLGGRYRIIGLLGRGGMGEVYRATDLTLGQSVALKFLPEEASRNQRLLERFHGEVRVARLVSHPNVCRVYDIGEIEGMPFISMEYVDGEDLASLLLRIGRLPADKAVETARKLCAGLAAAHDRGVIHRDLKPQNIMMNKRGEVVIMDFGLAAISDQLTGAEARNGTPAYMAPEQLKGAGVTARSDLYSLGLVLYELFTGKRPYDAKNLQQLIDLQESAHLTSMTSIASDIDPAVEKVIRRCLDPDAARRPASALAVMAALPGGDPLAAALAAGETPSPEMVAAAGTLEGMARKYSVPCLVFVLLCLVAAIPMRQARTAMMQAPLDQSPEVLAHRARQIAASFGYEERPADSEIWLEPRDQWIVYLRYMPQPHAWAAWMAADPAVRAIYRESRSALVAKPDSVVTIANPPQTQPGMATLTLDGNGRLLQFSAVPAQREAALAEPVTADTVFRAAGLDLKSFTEDAPSFRPDAAFDQWHAWKGPHPKVPNTELHLEIASWKGRIVQAQVFYPWTRAADAAEDHPTTLGRLRELAILAAMLGGGLLVLLLARRNWKLQRADRQGAWRVAAARFLLAAFAWLGIMHPTSESWFDSTLGAAGDWLASAVMLWVVYLALEPMLRARWPHSIVTWNRVLAGRWLDAQVGSDLLIGAVAGSFIWIAFKLLQMRGGEPSFMDLSLGYALGTRHWLGMHAHTLGTALRAGLTIFLAISGLRMLLRHSIPAGLVAALLFTMSESDVVSSANWVVNTAIFVVVYAILIYVLLRCGLVAAIMTLFFVNSYNGLILGTDWKAWYAPSGFATLLLMAGIALFAFWRSLGTRDLIGSEE